MHKWRVDIIFGQVNANNSYRVRTIPGFELLDNGARPVVTEDTLREARLCLSSHKDARNVRLRYTPVIERVFGVEYAVHDPRIFQVEVEL